MPRLLLLASLAGVCTGVASHASAMPPSHVVIVVEENHSHEDVIGSPFAPYINALAAAGAKLENMYGLTHPSQPNYLEFFSGSNQNILDNTAPAPGVPFTTLNLGAALRAGGRSFTGYSQGLPAPGALDAQAGPYQRKHNPWVNWQADVPGLNQLPPTVNQPFTAFPTDFSTLPTVSIVVPDQLSDMHDGTIAMADEWLATNIGPYAQWAMDHNALLIITWDEDSFGSRNHIPTIFYGPMVRPGSVQGVWTLHDLLRTIEDLYGIQHSGAAAKCRSIAGVFNSDLLVTAFRFQEGAVPAAGGAAYTGCIDTMIAAATPSTSQAASTVLVVDGSPESAALVRFESLVGSGSGQIPPGSRVVSAKLRLLTGSASGDSAVNRVRLHRMLRNWTEASTWNSFGGGISADGIEAATASEFEPLPNVLDAWTIFDVTSSVQQFVDNPAANFGWAVLPVGTDGWRWISREAFFIADRPVLDVVIDPDPACVRVLTQPVEQHACRGDRVEFFISARGVAPLSYQWLRDEVPLAGETASTLLIASAGLEARAQYRCVITGPCGSVTSEPAALVICPADINCDGGIDGSDVEAFFVYWAMGVPAGDLNEDGGVDGSDVEAFFQAWESGC